MRLEDLKNIRIGWILVLIIIILFIQLFSIHYNYTGKITTVVEPRKEVKNMKYPYPYFSDEWYTVSFVEYSIATKSLPLANPLSYNAPFPNLELPFNSFVSEMILLLDLNPLTQYTLLTIFSGLLICLLVYSILRVNKIGRFSSAVACLSVPYIINGANLPGIWTLIPLIMGIISMLLMFLFMSINSKKMILFMAFLTLIFYPPLFMLCGISLIFYFIASRSFSKREKINSVILFLGAGVVATLILSLFAFFIIKPFSNFISYISTSLFYETFTKDAIPDFSIWKVIPIPVLLFSLIGIFKIIKRKIWLVTPVFVGLAYWWLYSKVLWRLVIENERVVVATSVLITLMSGFGVYYLMISLRKIGFISRYKILQIVQILVLILFFISSFFYTQRNNWQELKLYSVGGDKVFSPTSPANNYLHPDDLELFEGIKRKRFLSIPWKGTVIGVATDNYPLVTKPGTISMYDGLFSRFMNGNCEEKLRIINWGWVDYLYLPKIDCEGLEPIGVSSEGLYLYKVLKD